MTDGQTNKRRVENKEEDGLDGRRGVGECNAVRRGGYGHGHGGHNDVVYSAVNLSPVFLFLSPLSSPTNYPASSSFEASSPITVIWPPMPPMPQSFSTFLRRFVRYPSFVPPYFAEWRRNYRAPLSIITAD